MLPHVCSLEEAVQILQEKHEEAIKLHQECDAKKLQTCFYLWQGKYLAFAEALYYLQGVKNYLKIGKQAGKEAQDFEEAKVILDEAAKGILEAATKNDPKGATAIRMQNGAILYAPVYYSDSLGYFVPIRNAATERRMQVFWDHNIGVYRETEFKQGVRYP